MGDTVYHKAAKDVASQIASLGTDPDKVDLLVKQYYYDIENKLASDTEPDRKDSVIEAEEIVAKAIENAGLDPKDVSKRVGKLIAYDKSDKRSIKVEEMTAEEREKYGVERREKRSAAAKKAAATRRKNKEEREAGRSLSDKLAGTYDLDKKKTARAEKLTNTRIRARRAEAKKRKDGGSFVIDYPGYTKRTVKVPAAAKPKRTRKVASAKDEPAAKPKRARTEAQKAAAARLKEHQPKIAAYRKANAGKDGKLMSQAQATKEYFAKLRGGN